MDVKEGGEWRSDVPRKVLSNYMWLCEYASESKQTLK